MAMNAAYLNLTADAGGTAITHIALLNSSNVEVGDARKAVTWTTASDGLIRPTADLEFTMTSGDEVTQWRGYSAETAGTDYGGATLTTATFSNDGTYTLTAAQTGIDHDAA